jgi:hypothetical protein
MSDDVIRLRKFAEGSRTTLGPVTWEAHPDGKGGYRPIEPVRRGTIGLPCPHCSAALVREGSAEAIRTAIFGCGFCHKPSGGRDAHVSPQPPRRHWIRAS